MQVELNIGLERKDGVLPVATYRQALATLRTAVTLTVDRTYTTRYFKDGESVEEIGLFVSFPWTASYDELVTLIGLLSIDLGQDCIAVYLPAKGVGALVGPKAKEWGAFNLEFFKRFDAQGNAV